MPCDQCEMLNINGLNCHETGCPNERRDRLRPECPECSRVFNLMDATDADEWSFGHDCEVS